MPHICESSSIEIFLSMFFSMHAASSLNIAAEAVLDSGETGSSFEAENSSIKILVIIMSQNDLFFIM